MGQTFGESCPHYVVPPYCGSLIWPLVKGNSSPYGIQKLYNHSKLANWKSPLFAFYNITFYNKCFFNNSLFVMKNPLNIWLWFGIILVLSPVHKGKHTSNISTFSCIVCNYMCNFEVYVTSVYIWNSFLKICAIPLGT